MNCILTDIVNNVIYSIILLSIILLTSRMIKIANLDHTRKDANPQVLTIQMKISIIGTSGRKTTPGTKDLTRQLFDKMVQTAYSQIKEMGDTDGTATLVSGGAAWADHVAVALFLKKGKIFKGLKLYLPCPFDTKLGKFYDTGVVDWRTNPGGTLNYYHRLFSEKLGRESLDDIKQAVLKGAVIDCSAKSFHSRNGEVAKSEIILAFTWGKKEPTDGGTLDTWKKVPIESKKIHFCLEDL